GVLDALKEKKAPATFFVMGSRAVKFPALLKRIHDEGHAIGNHSYNHPDFSTLTPAEAKQQILRAEAVINNVVGLKPKLFRPPYGEILPAELDWAKAQGYTVVNWDVDSSDWRQLSSDKVFRNVTKAVKPGSVILMHAGGGEGQDLSGTVK